MEAKPTEAPLVDEAEGNFYTITTKLDVLNARRSQEAELAAYKETAKAAQAEVDRLEAQLAEKEAALAAAEAALIQEQKKTQQQQQKTQQRQRDSQAQQQSAGRTFEATHYTAYCNGCSGVTATGLNVSHTIYSPEGYRIVAVDPRVIPLGTLLQITYKNGTTFTAIAADTGGAIKGNKIDILVASKKEAYALGRVPVTVRIIKYSK